MTHLGYDSGWTTESHLLAAVVDLLAGANWQRAGSKGQKPKPIPRAAEVAKKAGRLDRERARAERFIARQKAKKVE